LRFTFLHMSFVCRRCGHVYKEKKSLQIHLQRMSPCDIIVEDIDRSVLLKELSKERPISEYNKLCQFCGKGFKADSNRINHQKKCKLKVQEKPHEKKETVILDEKDKLIAELKKEIERLKFFKKKPVKQNIGSGNIVNGIVNGNVNGNIIQNINIHNFGNENIDHIKKDILKHILDINIPKLIREVHFNMEVPENMNIQWKDDHIQRRENNKWIKIPISTGINQLIISKAKILEDGVQNIENTSDVVDSIQIIKEMKQSAIRQEDSDLLWEVALRLKKEQQKAIARDKTSEEPYCYTISPSTSDEER